MMKILAVIVALVGVNNLSPAESFRLEGEPFNPSTNSEIVWSAPTNNLPRGLWIYKVMPEAFSAAVISNAMIIGHFQMKDLTRPPDKNQISFQNKNEFNRTRFLTINPTIGTMKYQSDTDASAPAENVPSSEETEKLARDVLFQLGIDRSLLAEKVRNGYDNIRTRYDRTGHQTAAPEATMRGISFERRIDGVLLSDQWCFLIHFGNHGIVEDFSLCWRNILPSESHQVATPEQIVKMIKSGKVVLPPQMSDTTGLDSAKKLTVVKITPHYYNGIGKESLDFMYPYADLEMTADSGNTNATTFFLNCPILVETKTE
jgi:hypothetical protein